MLNRLCERLFKYKDNVAFYIEGTEYTYQALLQRISDIRHSIQSKEHISNNRVGIITHNHIDTYAGIIACWSLEMAYIPINPKIPDERNNLIIKEAEISLVISANSELVYDFPLDKFICTKDLASFPVDHWNWRCEPEQELYVLFTSGSTGIPKGVPITIKNIEAFLKSYFDLGFKCDHQDRFLQMFDLTFDVSVASYLVPLLIGASIYTVPDRGVKYMQIYKLLKEQKITFASLVPSILNYLRPYYKEISLPSLRYCILTAEASNNSLVEEWSGLMPNGEIYNLYGPTEATIWCTGYKFDAESIKGYNGMLAIGTAFSQVTAMIVNDDFIKVAGQEKGELCISSEQVTKGYINNPDRNQTSFILQNNDRYYRTGDLCYTDEDGTIIYCGRIDHQVKIQGFRIELSEIEIVVRESLSINNVAIAFTNQTGIQQICLFIEGPSTNIEEVKAILEKKLPYYMIPAQIIGLSSLPINTSGKIDRMALKNSLENSYA